MAVDSFAAGVISAVGENKDASLSGEASDNSYAVNYDVDLEVTASAQNNQVNEGLGNISADGATSSHTLQSVATDGVYDLQYNAIFQNPNEATLHWESNDGGGWTSRDSVTVDSNNLGGTLTFTDGTLQVGDQVRMRLVWVNVNTNKDHTVGGTLVYTEETFDATSGITIQVMSHNGSSWTTHDTSSYSVNDTDGTSDTLNQSPTINFSRTNVQTVRVEVSSVDESGTASSRQHDCDPNDVTYTAAPPDITRSVTAVTVTLTAVTATASTAAQDQTVTPSAVTATFTAVTATASTVSGAQTVTPGPVTLTFSATTTQDVLHVVAAEAITTSVPTPTVSTVSGQTVQPVPVSVTLTAVTASVQADVTVTPAAVSATFTAVTATVQAGTVTVTPAPVTATFTAVTATASATGGPQTVTPSAVTITFSATTTQDVLHVVAAEAITTTVPTPTVDVVTEQVVTPGPVAITFIAGEGVGSSFSPDSLVISLGVVEPTVVASVTVAAAPVVATLTVVEPSVQVAVTVTPASVVTTFSVVDPTVATTTTVTPASVVATLSVVDPVVVANVTLTPTPVTATFSVVDPVVLVALEVQATPVVLSLDAVTAAVQAGVVTVTPAPVAGTFSVVGPAVVTSVTVQAAPVAVTFSVVDPGAVATPAPVVTTFTAVEPSVALDQVATPAPVVATFTAVQPTVLGSEVTIAPNAVVVTLSVVEPAVTTGEVVVTPAAVSTTFSVVDPTLTTSVTVQADPATATFTAVTAVATLGLTATPAPVVATLSVVEPVVVPGAVTVTPTAVSATFSVVDPTVAVGVTVQASPVTATFTAVTATASTGTVVQPAPVVATFTAVAPTIQTGAVTLTPAPVVVTFVVPAPSIGGEVGSVVTPPPVLIEFIVPVEVGRAHTPDPNVITATAVTPGGGRSTTPEPVVMSHSVVTPIMQLGDPGGVATGSSIIEAVGEFTASGDAEKQGKVDMRGVGLLNAAGSVDRAPSVTLEGEAILTAVAEVDDGKPDWSKCLGPSGSLSRTWRETGEPILFAEDELPLRKLTHLWDPTVSGKGEVLRDIVSGADMQLGAYNPDTDRKTLKELFGLPKDMSVVALNQWPGALGDDSDREFDQNGWAHDSAYDRALFETAEWEGTFPTDYYNVDGAIIRRHADVLEGERYFHGWKSFEGQEVVFLNLAGRLEGAPPTHPDNVHKLLTFRADGDDRAYVNVHAPPEEVDPDSDIYLFGADRTVSIIVEELDDTRNLIPNLTTEEIGRRDKAGYKIRPENRVNLLLVMNTPGAADGEVHWWVNGIKAGEYTNLEFRTQETTQWDEVAIDPRWGTPGTRTQEDITNDSSVPDTMYREVAVWGGESWNGWEERGLYPNEPEGYGYLTENQFQERWYPHFTPRYYSGKGNFWETHFMPELNVAGGVDEGGRHLDSVSPYQFPSEYYMDPYNREGVVYWKALYKTQGTSGAPGPNYQMWQSVRISGGNSGRTIEPREVYISLKFRITHNFRNFSAYGQVLAYAMTGATYDQGQWPECCLVVHGGVDSETNKIYLTFKRGRNRGADGATISETSPVTSSVEIERGVFYDAEVKIVLNTDGEEDGEAKLWLNGDLVISDVEVEWPRHNTDSGEFFQDLGYLFVLDSENGTGAQRTIGRNTYIELHQFYASAPGAGDPQDPVWLDDPPALEFNKTGSHKNQHTRAPVGPVQPQGSLDLLTPETSEYFWAGHTELDATITFVLRSTDTKPQSTLLKQTSSRNEAAAALPRRIFWSGPDTKAGRIGVYDDSLSLTGTDGLNPERMFDFGPAPIDGQYHAVTFILNRIQNQVIGCVIDGERRILQDSRAKHLGNQIDLWDHDESSWWYDLGIQLNDAGWNSIFFTDDKWGSNQGHDHEGHGVYYEGDSGKILLHKVALTFPEVQRMHNWLRDPYEAIPPRAVKRAIPTTPAIIDYGELWHSWMEVQWQESTDGTSGKILYEVQFSSDGGSTWETVGALDDVDPQDNTSFGLNTRRASTDRENRFRVRAFNGAAYSAWAETGDFETAPYAATPLTTRYFDLDDKKAKHSSQFPVDSGYVVLDEYETECGEIVALHFSQADLDIFTEFLYTPYWNGSFWSYPSMIYPHTEAGFTESIVQGSWGHMWLYYPEGERGSKIRLEHEHYEHSIWFNRWGFQGAEVDAVLVLAPNGRLIVECPGSATGEAGGCLNTPREFCPEPVVPDWLDCEGPSEGPWTKIKVED